MEWVEVADSAVKIGFGALISAVASFAAMKASHVNERRKDLRAHRIKLLEYVAEQYEKLFANYVTFRSFLRESMVQRDDPNAIEITQKLIEQYESSYDSGLNNALDNVFSAGARLSLIGAEESRQVLFDFAGCVSNMRDAFVVDGKILTLDEFDAFVEKNRVWIDKFNAELARLYSEIT